MRRTRPLLRCGTLCCLTLTTVTVRAALTHQYTFNDGTANDSVGSANGTLMGAATVSGGQVHLTGASGTYANLPGPTIAINTYIDATFEGWFIYNDTRAWQRLFDFGATYPSSTSGADYIFYTPNTIDSPGVNRVAIVNQFQTIFPREDRANGGPTLSTGTEHYVAVVLDGGMNGGSGTMAVYVDGLLNAASGVNPVGLSWAFRPLQNIENTNAYLGRSNFLNDPYLNGAIDEFNIYNTALDAATIAAHYAAGPVPVPEPSCLLLATMGFVALFLFCRRKLQGQVCRAVPVLAFLFVVSLSASGPLAAQQYTLVRTLGPFAVPGLGYTFPTAVAVDAARNVWVADESGDYGQTVNRVQEFTAGGDLVQAFGAYGSGNGQLNGVGGIAADSLGNIWLSDGGNNRIQEFTSSGTFLRTVGTQGTGNGQFNSPAGLAIDPSRNVWVVDSGNNRVEEFTGGGTFIRKFGSYGSGNGQFEFVYGVAVDLSGNVFVGDSFNYRIQEFTNSGTFIRAFSTVNPDDYLDQRPPYAIAVDSTGKVYDADANKVTVFTSTGAFVATMSDPFCGTPDGVAVDPLGNVWTTSNSSDHPVVDQFSLVPEPSSLALLGLGLPALWWRWRRLGLAVINVKGRA